MKTSVYRVSKYLYIYNIDIFLYVLEMLGKIQMWQIGSLGTNSGNRDIGFPGGFLFVLNSNLECL